MRPIGSVVSSAIWAAVRKILDRSKFSVNIGIFP